MHSNITKKLSSAILTIALGSLGLVSCDLVQDTQADSSSSTIPVNVAAVSSSSVTSPSQLSSIVWRSSSSSSVENLNAPIDTSYVPPVLISSTTMSSSSISVSVSSSRSSSSALIFSSSSFSLVSSSSYSTVVGAMVWDGSDGSGAVQTGGYWYKYADNAESADAGPGASTSDFPDASMVTDVVGAWVMLMNGVIDVTFTINPTTYKYPYAGIGFNWTDPVAASPQTWSNICVTYSMSGGIPMRIELGNNPVLDGNNPFSIVLPAQTQLATTCFPVAKFSQESGWGTKTTVATAMANSLGIRFEALLRIPPTVARTVNLKITKIVTN